MSDRRRWLVLLAPAVLPWVHVSYATGGYTVFALGWVDPGPRVTPIFTFLQHGLQNGLRSFTVAYPLAVALFALALAIARVTPPWQGTRAVVAALLGLAAANVTFFAAGLDAQSTITAIPLGVVWLGAAAVREYYAFYTG
ncbi:MAG: hypothetical protein ABEJ59_06495 [Halanaeroarchaeum sp.]